MVLDNKIRIFSRIFMAFLLIFSFSCEDQGLIVKCPDCVEEEPININLSVKLDPGRPGYVTYITVYEGNIEDSVIYNTYNTMNSEFTIPVSVNKKYTVTATYFLQNNYYVAVDAAQPRVKYEKSQCDSPCYFVYDKSLDLRLKYTK